MIYLIQGLLLSFTVFGPFCKLPLHICLSILTVACFILYHKAPHFSHMKCMAVSTPVVMYYPAFFSHLSDNSLITNEMTHEMTLYIKCPTSDHSTIFLGCLVKTFPGIFISQLWWFVASVNILPFPDTESYKGFIYSCLKQISSRQGGFRWFLFHHLPFSNWPSPISHCLLQCCNLFLSSIAVSMETVLLNLLAACFPPSTASVHKNFYLFWSLLFTMPMQKFTAFIFFTDKLFYLFIPFYYMFTTFHGVV